MIYRIMYPTSAINILVYYNLFRGLSLCLIQNNIKVIVYGMTDLPLCTFLTYVLFVLAKRICFLSIGFKHVVQTYNHSSLTIIITN
jgi:hypothetical protein